MLVFESAFLAEALQDELIVDSTPHVSSGQEIELTGEVVRADEDTVTVAGKGLGHHGQAQCRAARHRPCGGEADESNLSSPGTRSHHVH